MHLQTDSEKMIARALHDAGQTDREIADNLHTSVNNVIWWRRAEDLHEHLSPEAKAQVEAYTPPVRRENPPRVRSVAALAVSPSVPAAESRLITPQQARAAYVAPVKPEGDNALEIGLHMDAQVYVDLEELLTTRLLIQGNSGSGKTHLLRRLLEECAGIVQQIIIDPEGDFASFGDAFGHTIIDAANNSAGRLETIARRVRSLRGSVVLNLDGLETDGQRKAATAFLTGLFDAPAEDWHPAIVAVDEVHLFAPIGDDGEDREIRKQSLQAMANLMCRGRKRGLAGIIATQRLSKLHKNVAAEASNFFLGRTLLDIDINRALDLLGMAKADGEQVRSLNRGEFLGLGPAIARRPLLTMVGPCMTQGKAGAEKGITPLPSLKPEDMAAALLADTEDEEALIEEHVVVPFERRQA